MYKYKSIAQVIIAAILFGSSAPISKILLGKIDPIPLAAFIYIGSGVGLLIFKIIEKYFSTNYNKEAPLGKKDIPWLLAAVFFGGVFAPIILMNSLKTTPASTASLLLNFESVATTVIAVCFFKESAGKRIWFSIIFITLAAIILSWDFSNQWGLSIGAIGVITACVSWGMDNNFTGKISLKDPFSIVIIKGIGAGSFSLILAIILKSSFPSIGVIVEAMILGCFSYGLSIVLFVLALRELGSARTSALFGTSPFIGALVSFVLCGDKISLTFVMGFPLMVIGTVLLLKENHEHKHLHKAITHEHKHNHIDGHHGHVHDEKVDKDIYHSHVHTHDIIEHSHPHTPDSHHKHVHN
ncbi:EamA family transporter [Clostridiaceae bacterium UIB06]|uniref:EamA family transporter n=1 Tax=Clostridium thailandense TaxID=2794346 RepID=A0A949TYR4_9CLOT|nr:DMT family transporter [Clostridium thailandense]MBV7274075.1 EamA family transporter [Clostridium thailandense]MCH5137701.1 EamA family transporter [Clostridiaceae bacterium UIB06]